QWRITKCGCRWWRPPGRQSNHRYPEERRMTTPNQQCVTAMNDAPASTKVDPIEASVLHRRLKSITEEMGLTLLRTTRSPILNEARDFVTGLYDAKGQMLEQTEY